MKRITLSIRSLAAAAVALTLLVGGVSAAASTDRCATMVPMMRSFGHNMMERREHFEPYTYSVTHVGRTV